MVGYNNSTDNFQLKNMDQSGDEDSSESFDVFVSYSKQNSQWVTETLIKRLEDEDFSVCWDDRDFQPGVTKLQNKVNALLKSKKTIVVFSPSYVTQEQIWKYIETDKKADIHFNDLSIIPVMYEQCEIPTLFDDLWTLDWVNPVARKFFWKKLIKAIKTESESSKGKDSGKKILKTNGRLHKRSGKSTKKTTALISNVPASPTLSRGNEKNIAEDTRDTSPVDSKVFDSFNCYRILSNEKGSTSAYIDPGIEGSMSNSNNTVVSLPSTKKILNKEECSSQEETVNNEEVRQCLAKQDTDCNSESQNTGEKTNIDEEDSNQRSPFESYRQNLSPRLLGNFVPEDDDLSKDDVDRLTFKIEEVYAKGLLGDTSELEKNLEAYKIRNKKLQKRQSKKLYQKFQSAQEQMCVLDSLQEWEEKIRSKFEACRNSQRKRVYRRLLERYNEAVEKTVNGDKDEALVSCLQLHIVNSCKSEERVQCCCCDKLFHSERALEMHLSACVNRTWTELMKYTPQKVFES